MNSTEEGKNVISSDEVPSCSRVSSDNNANTNNNVDESKGAIPKTKIITKNGVASSTRKSAKVNNNIENMPTLNCMINSTSDIHKVNGYSKNSSTTNIYMTNSSQKVQDQIGGLNSEQNGVFDYNLRVPNGDEMEKLIFKPLQSNGSSESLSFNGYQDFYGLKSDSDSSSDDTDLLSVSDDGCIYTYKADNVADLPKSFFNIEIPLLESVEPNDANRQGNSSPEMDFLEMDFDPGPSGDAEDLENGPSTEIAVKISQVVNNTTKKANVTEVEKETAEITVKNVSVPATEGIQTSYEQMYKIIQQFRFKSPPVKKDINLPWSCSVNERTRCRRVKTASTSWNDNSTSGIVPDKVMIFSESEAKSKQITQIAPSSCGATAVLNVLNALRIPLPTTDKIQEMVSTRFRENTAPLTEYLISRSKAGCNHRDIIKGLYMASEGTVYSRFFAMYPERCVNLNKWLGYWIKQGAVPIATLNLQKTEGNIPDSWHHQMIYGIGPEGIYMANPLMCVKPDELWPQLSSESILLIRRQDVISRYDSRFDLPKLLSIEDVRWQEINVAGQVAYMIRETRRDIKPGSNLTSHLKIPAEYRSGITLAIDMKSPAFTFLSQCPELPLFSES